MKTQTTPTSCDGNIILFFPEMITLLMGKDPAARQAFRNDVLKRAAEIRMESRNGNVPGGTKARILSFPMGYPCSA